MSDEILLRYEKLRIRGKELESKLVPKTLTALLNSSTEEYLDKLAAQLDRIEKKLASEEKKK